jgi:hypothetical protein
MKLRSLTLALSVAVGTVLLNSCTQDPCKDVVCQNGGTCVAGNCDCVTGYEGDSCQTLSRAKFIGTWAVDDDGTSSGPANYNITVTAGTAVTAVNIDGLWQLFVNSITANIDGNAITIPLQEPDNDDYTIEGSGTITPGTTSTVAMTYTVTDPISQQDVVTSAWTK